MSNMLFIITFLAFLLFGPFLLTAQELLLTDDFTSDYTWMNDDMEDGFVEADTIWIGGDKTQGYGLFFMIGKVIRGAKAKTEKNGDFPPKIVALERTVPTFRS